MSPTSATNGGDFAERFRTWFDKWGPGLWILCARSARSATQAEEDFLEVLDLVFRKARARLRHAGDEALAALFLREWFKVQRAKNSPASPSELPGEDRALLAALFRADWNLARASHVFGFSPKAIRYRAFQALVRSAPASKFPAVVSRDCVRCDLRAVDNLLGLEWSDPLRLFGRRDFDAHLAACERCRELARELKETVRLSREASPGPMPKSSFSFLESGPVFGSRSFLSSWVSTLPWYVRVPLQIAFAAAVVFGVVAVPYLGDFFPELNRTVPEVGRRIRRLVDGVSFELPKRPNLAPSSPPLPVAIAMPTPAPSPLVAIALPPSPSPSAVPTVAAKTNFVPPKPSPTPAPAAKAPVVANTSKLVDPKAFFQWGAISKDLGDSAPKVLEVLNRYAVERAGDLTLGARYLGGLYYHFNVDEQSYEKLVAEITALGFTRFTRAKSRGIKDHPPGKTRVVFLLRPSSTKAAKPAAPNSAPESDESGAESPSGDGENPGDGG